MFRIGTYFKIKFCYKGNDLYIKICLFFLHNTRTPLIEKWVVLAITVWSVQTRSNFLLWICFLIILLFLPLQVHQSFIGLFDHMLWISEFVHLIKSEEGYTYSSPYGCVVFQVKVLFAKPACAFLQWHGCRAEQNRRHENESRKKDRIESEQEGV